MTKRKRVTLPGDKAWMDRLILPDGTRLQRVYPAADKGLVPVRVVRESELRKWLKENGR